MAHLSQFESGARPRFLRSSAPLYVKEQDACPSAGYFPPFWRQAHYDFLNRWFIDT